MILFHILIVQRHIWLNRLWLTKVYAIPKYMVYRGLLVLLLQLHFWKNHVRMCPTALSGGRNRFNEDSLHYWEYLFCFLPQSMNSMFCLEMLLNYRCWKDNACLWLTRNTTWPHRRKWSPYSNFRQGNLLCFLETSFLYCLRAAGRKPTEAVVPVGSSL